MARRRVAGGTRRRAPRTAFKKGAVKRGGRKKGTPNKVTSDVREAIRKLAQDTFPNFCLWMNRAARRSPEKAAGLWLRMIEYHIPKLTRTEHTGLNGDPLETALKITHQIEQTSDVATASALYLQLVKQVSDPTPTVGGADTVQ